MLNHPLSLLSDDLIAYIVSYVANRKKYLHSLSLADRAFTRFCQAYLIKELRLSDKYGGKDRIMKKLAKTQAVFDSTPSIADFVRVVDLTVTHNHNGWLFNDPAFISIFRLLNKSPVPPHTLRLSGDIGNQFRLEFENHARLLVGQLMQSCFARSLTILNLTWCRDVPVAFFLVCPALREVVLCDVDVSASGEIHEQCFDEEWRGREPPALEDLKYCNSACLVKYMIKPPPHFQMDVVRWSKLRVLRLSPHEKEEMECLQPILDAASDTLEELHLTEMSKASWGTGTPQDERQLPLARLVNLRRLPRLRTFALYIILNECDDDTPEPTALRDINTVLNTISSSSEVSAVSFKFRLVGENDFSRTREEDWAGLCDELVRISGGRPLELRLWMAACPPMTMFAAPPGKEDIVVYIEERMSSLSHRCPEIITQLTHPARSKKR